MDLLTVPVRTKFLIVDFLFLKCLFVFILDAIFCGTIFFIIFEDSVWLFKSS